jgi:hypothetical protein
VCTHIFFALRAYSDGGVTPAEAALINQEANSWRPMRDAASEGQSLRRRATIHPIAACRLSGSYNVLRNTCYVLLKVSSLREDRRGLQIDCQ